MIKIILFIAIGINFNTFANGLFQSNINGSFTSLAKDDSVIQTHNSLSFQIGSIYIGGYAGYEKFHVDVVDSSLGVMLRYGQAGYIELQLGSFTRTLQTFNDKLKGTGFISNIIIGKNISNHFALSIFTTIKKITAGELEKRTIVDVYPFLGMKVDF